MRTFNITITPREELPWPYNQQCEEMLRVIIGPFEWEQRVPLGPKLGHTWNTIRHLEDDTRPPSAHTVLMLDALVAAEVEAQERFAAADAAMGDPNP